MCNRVMVKIAENAVGYFHKGNEPEPIRMSIIVAPCKCGDRYYAKIEGGIVWVEAEAEGKQDVDDAAIHELATDLARAGAETA